MEKVPSVPCKDIKEWEEINTFVCPLARLTPETCEKLRARPSLKDFVYKREDGNIGMKCPQLVRPTVCENCKDWQRLCEEVYQKRKAYLEKQKQKEKEEAPMGIKGLDDSIKQKAKELYLQGMPLIQIAQTLGIGKSTVSEWKKKGNWDAEKQNTNTQSKGKSKNNGNKPLRITIDFSNHEELLKTLEMRAKEELRPLEMQILWELKSRLEGRRAL